MAQLGLYVCQSCPADCETATAPAFSINECVDAIEFVESEISVIYIVGVSTDDCSEPAAKPTDWTDANDWADNIDNTDANKIRKINVIGDIPAAEPKVINLSKGRTKNGLKTFLLNFDLDEFNATNYTAMRGLECGFTGFIWYETRGGLLFGGPKGIKVNLVNINSPNERGDNVYQKISGQFTWESKCSPDMITSPLSSGIC